MPGGAFVLTRLRADAAADLVQQAPCSARSNGGRAVAVPAWAEAGSGALQFLVNQIQACADFKHYLVRPINGGVRIGPGEDNRKQAGEFLRSSLPLGDLGVPRSCRHPLLPVLRADLLQRPVMVSNPALGIVLLQIAPATGGPPDLIAAAGSQLPSVGPSSRSFSAGSSSPPEVSSSRSAGMSSSSSVMT